MPDCQSPKCHEAMNKNIGKKVSKRALWIGLMVIGLPLLGTGLTVWSQQKANILKYVEKKDMVVHATNQTKLQTVVEHTEKDIQEIKREQAGAREDIKEILRHLRDR